MACAKDTRQSLHEVCAPSVTDPGLLSKGLSDCKQGRELCCDAPAVDLVFFADWGFPDSVQIIKHFPEWLYFFPPNLAPRLLTFSLSSCWQTDEIILFPTSACSQLDINYRLFKSSSLFYSLFSHVPSLALPSLYAVHVLIALTHPCSPPLPQRWSCAGNRPSSTPDGWHLLLLPQAEVMSQLLQKQIQCYLLQGMKYTTQE